MRTTTLWLLACISAAAQADYLEVRRSAAIYAAPSKQSEVLAQVGPGIDGGTTILHVARNEPLERGYLKVRLPAEPGYGYVHKTAGRMHRDHEGPYVPYDRDDYRHWVDADRDCEDTRVEVLVRDAVPGKVKVAKQGSSCRVVSGTWEDRYSGATLTKPLALDIDHLVALKNAHESGGWAWSPQRKMEYANYLDDPLHLLAVSATENRRKSDKGPDRYMPPNQSYACEYVNAWLNMKYSWGLEIPEGVQQAIDQVLAGCPEDEN